ncbi:MAG: peroxide stress protein YaaA [Betaproteobacteria bacterium]
MIIVLSPAKTLDFETPLVTERFTQPDFLEESAQLVQRLRKLPATRLEQMMEISPALAQLNAERFQSWQLPFSPSNSRQAALAFAGDVYEGLAAPTLDEPALQWAQSRVRILSGLYGLLRPLDLIQPYRLEMGTRLDTGRSPDLYRFWGDRLARTLVTELAEHRHPVLVNLASNEYFRAVPPKSLGLRVIQPVFEERRASGWKVVSFSAKRARGSMTRYAIDHRVENPDDLREFDVDGYRFDEGVSDADTWVFRRG